MALMTAIWKRLEQMMLASTGQDSAVSDTDTSDSDHETARVAKRVDRGVEEPQPIRS